MTRKLQQHATALLTAAEKLVFSIDYFTDTVRCQEALAALREVIGWCNEPYQVDPGPELPFIPPAQLRNLSKLPKFCWTTAAGPGKLSIITAGQDGHQPIEQSLIDAWMVDFESDTVSQLCDKLNSREGVTKNTRLAMECGSMFGWHVPGADPNAYNKKIDRPEQLIGK